MPHFNFLMHTCTTTLFPVLYFSRSCKNTFEKLLRTQQQNLFYLLTASCMALSLSLFPCIKYGHEIFFPSFSFLCRMEAVSIALPPVKYTRLFITAFDPFALYLLIACFIDRNSINNPRPYKQFLVDLA